MGRGWVALSSAAQEFWEEAVAAWVLWKVRCTHPVKDPPSLKTNKQTRCVVKIRITQIPTLGDPKILTIRGVWGDLKNT